MKLSDVQLCCDTECNELVPIGETACPSCTCTVFLNLEQLVNRTRQSAPMYSIAPSQNTEWNPEAKVGGHDRILWDRQMRNYIKAFPPGTFGTELVKMLGDDYLSDDLKEHG